MRDDPGRSPQIELDPERSFDGPLSGQSVYEQTSGVLRHTRSVRGFKVQEQDWVSDIQVRTLRTLADAPSNDPARSRLFSSSSQVSRPPTLETVLEGSKDLEGRNAVKADPVLPTGSTCVQ